MKIASFENDVWPLREEFWSQKIVHEIIEKVNIPEGTFKELWPELSRKAQVVLTEDNQTTQVLNYFTSLPSDIQTSQSCDSLLFEDGKWWVRNFFAIALKESLVKRARRLDTHCYGYVTGSGAQARTALAVLIEIGFSKINWVAEEPALLEPTLAILKRNFFGVDIKLIEDSQLTLQPNNGSILINTLSVLSKSPLLEDLYYLNFIQKNGVVVDTHLFPIENHLLTEAENVNIRVIPGWYLEGLRDFLLLGRLGKWRTSGETNEIYLRDWEQFLKTRPTSSQI